MKRLFLLLFALLPMLVSAQNSTSGNNVIRYTTTDNKVLNKKGICNANLISNTYAYGQGIMVFDKPITEIGWAAFNDCTSLKSIKIPNSVTLIGEDAFGGCTSLTSVTIPNSVTKIVGGAFLGCSSLKSITIPNSVTAIGWAAFNDCTSLKSVTIGNGVTKIGEGVFDGCTSLESFYGKFASEDNRCLIKDGVLLEFAPNGLTEYTIPNSVTKIEYSAFSGCSSLKSIKIPNSVTKIDGEAFKGCTSLTSIIIPNSVTSIRNRTFSGCSSLKSITIPNGVTSIGSSAFGGCSSLESITIPNSVTEIGEEAFSGCTSLTSVYCKPTTPPAGGSNMFDVNASGRTIYVPRNSVEAYKAASYWSDYASYIEGYDF